MFNRELRVNVVKSKKNDESVDTTDSHFEGKAAIIGKAVNDAIKKIGMITVLYVVLDTGRKVLIATASK